MCFGLCRTQNRLWVFAYHTQKNWVFDRFFLGNAYICPKLGNAITQNFLQCFDDKNLNVKFNASGEYPWKITVTNLNFSVAGIDFLIVNKLTVDPFNFCLVDKINNRVIPLKQLSLTYPNCAASCQKKRISPNFRKIF